MRAIWDADYLGYKVAFAMEERYVELGGVRWNNRKEILNTLIEAHGEEKGHDEYSKIKEDIKDVQQQIGSERKAYSIVNSMIKRVNREVGASSYKMFLEGNSEDGALPLFRWEKAELSEYKGNRKGTISPLLKESVKEYIIANHPSEICLDGYEADDHVVMESYSLSKRRIDNIVIATDKDAKGTPCRVYNPDKHSYHEGNRFGKLFEYTKGGKKRVGGEGRIWLYYQMASGDDVDNYKPNCFSAKRWGSVSAYRRLRKCKNDREAIQCLIDIFQHLYPESQEVVGWRGNLIKIDWLYVLEEMFILARMKRWKGDDITFEEIFNKMDINYG